MRNLINRNSLIFAFGAFFISACNSVNREEAGGIVDSQGELSQEGPDQTRMTPAELANLPDVDSKEEQEELVKKMTAITQENDAFMLDTPELPGRPALGDDASQGKETNGTSVHSVAYSSVLKYGLHPRASDAIQAAGIYSSRITQTIGTDPASAGTHLQDGTYQGYPYSSATDFTVSGLTSTQIKNMLDRLAMVGFAAWYRQNGYDGWTGANHIHAVYVNTLMKASLRSQVLSWLEGRNGLRSNRIYNFHRWTRTSTNTVRSKFASGQSGRSNGGNDILPGAVYLSKLHFGQTDSDSVKRLQVVLGLMPIDGYYGPMTDEAVRAEQAQAGEAPDPWRQSYVGPRQAERLFTAGTGYTIFP